MNKLLDNNLPDTNLLDTNLLDTNLLDTNLLDTNIINKLIKLYKSKNVPNIIFHGDNLTGKKTLLEYFLKLIYKNNENFQKYVLIINCAHGKGNIKFIRENLKYFANSIVEANNGYLFKSIILLNADKLTTDAQSALRRCIEIYNHSTRFFIIVDNKYKILKPILSRFSDIYCNEKILKKNSIKKTETLNKLDVFNCKNYNFCNKKLYKLNDLLDISNSVLNNLNDNILNEIILLTNKLYNNGFCANLIAEYIKNKLQNNLEKYRFLLLFNKFKKELRNEKILIFFCLNFLVFRNISTLENISFI